jgi:hypothetical protein
VQRRIYNSVRLKPRQTTKGEVAFLICFRFDHLILRKSINDNNFFFAFFLFLVRKCIFVIHCCFQNKSLSELLKKSMFQFEKKYFDSLALKRL